jgi:hypothetical protein
MNEIQSTKSFSKLKEALRWLAVLPAAICGFLLGHNIVKLFFYLFLKDRTECNFDFEYFLLKVVSPIFSSFVAIIFGYHIAPKWKNIIGSIIGVLIIVLCIILMYIHWLINGWYYYYFIKYDLVFFLNMAFTAVFLVMKLFTKEPLLERYKKLENTLRWLAVLPAAIGGGYFTLLFSIMFNEFVYQVSLLIGLGISPSIYLFNFNIISPVISSVAAVSLGNLVAPSAKKVVALIISVSIFALSFTHIVPDFAEFIVGPLKLLPINIFYGFKNTDLIINVSLAIGAGLALWVLWKNN